MRKVFLVLIVMLSFVTVGYADDCASCSGGDAVEEETIVPPNGHNILNRLEYHAYYHFEEDCDEQSSDCPGWIYLDGDTSYVISEDFIYAVVLKDYWGSGGSGTPHIACAFLGNELESNVYGDNVLDDPDLDDWEDAETIDEDWIENENDNDWGEIIKEALKGYPTDANGKPCAHYIYYNVPENPLENGLLNIHQDLSTLDEGAYYSGKCHYRRVEDDDASGAVFGLEVMSYPVDGITLYNTSPPDSSWRYLIGGNSFFKFPTGHPDAGTTPGHEITCVIAYASGGGEVLADQITLKPQTSKNGAIQTSSEFGESDGGWVHVDENFVFNHLSEITIYAFDISE